VEETQREILKLGPSMTVEQRQEMLCANSQEYFIPTLYQTSFPFDSVAKKQFGQDWLAPINRPYPYFCHLLGGQPARTLVTKLKKNGDEDSLVFRWDSVRRLVLQIIKNPEDLPHC
jgi:hypothetical protein